jgi:uncharacterized lipoprotein
MNARIPMTKTRFFLLASLMSGVVLATGCSSLVGSCRKAPPYGEEKDLPPLRIPVGLDAPDTREALEIPALDEPVAPRDPKDGCLEEPPQATFVPTPPQEGEAAAPAPVSTATVGGA